MGNNILSGFSWPRRTREREREREIVFYSILVNSRANVSTMMTILLKKNCCCEYIDEIM